MIDKTNDVAFKMLRTMLDKAEEVFESYFDHMVEEGRSVKSVFHAIESIIQNIDTFTSPQNLYNFLLGVYEDDEDKTNEIHSKIDEFFNANNTITGRLRVDAVKSWGIEGLGNYSFGDLFWLLYVIYYTGNNESSDGVLIGALHVRLEEILVEGTRDELVAWETQHESLASTKQLDAIIGAKLPVLLATIGSLD